MINNQPINVSIILNVHNEGHIVYPTLRSIAQARAFAHNSGILTEFIIVLDNPDSLTQKYIQQSELCKEAIIETIEVKDLGLARNHGTKVAQGDFITFLDADDLWGYMWITKCYLSALSYGPEASRIIWHPEFNLVFGKDDHLLLHRDMDDPEYEPDFLLATNYWTALSFGPRQIYESHPYFENQIKNGFGFEDWNWNTRTIKVGVKHKTANDTVHFIRRKRQGSLLQATNQNYCIMTPIFQDHSPLANQE